MQIPGPGIREAAEPDRLERGGADLVLTKQPMDFVWKYDHRCLSLIAAGDRIRHSHKVVLSVLEKGKCVISDRYFYSCIANLRVRGYPEGQWIWEAARRKTILTISKKL